MVRVDIGIKDDRVFLRRKEIFDIDNRINLRVWYMFGINVIIFFFKEIDGI